MEEENKKQSTLDEYEMNIVPFNWKAYNKSQTHEKHLFIKLLHELSRMVEMKHSYVNKGGMMPTPHIIFCIGMKVYLRMSGRRLISDLEMLRDRGYISSVPHFNTILNYFHAPSITKHLHYLISLSALPVAQLEEEFNSAYAIDATGVSMKQYKERWSTVRQKYYRHKDYKKVHCISGTKSNIIAGCIVTDGNKADSPYFKKLLKDATENFNIKEISADAAYLSREHLQLADDLNISPYILFKRNSVGHSKGFPMWGKSYNLFKKHHKKFLKAYHRRSNVESSFMMWKSRFDGFTSFRNHTAQVNEILCKVLAHNITVLIQEMFLSDIEIDFIDCKKRYVAQG